jgi:nucleotide-binding universal stress UspA family protein
MTEIAFPDAVVVAVDFSPCSLRALDTALSWRRAGTELTVLHVIDTAFSRRMEEAGICSYAEAIEKLKARAQESFTWMRNERGGAAFETMTVEGLPFLEIVKIATDLDCGLIVLGSHGSAGVEQLLFGSTAEKVLRGARQPVLCVP